mgnify:CR=1 FL=1
MAGKEVKVSVVAETRKFEAAMGRLGRAPGLTALKDKLAATATAAGRAMGVVVKTVAATAAGVAAATTAVVGGLASMGADLEQSAGAVRDVFKESADQMGAFADKAATSVGLSTNAYNELATVIGSQLKNAGVPMTELAGRTNDLISTGADLAAMFGGTTQDAVNALSSALKGERDPIERYGVSLRQASIDARAAELGFQKVNGAFDQEAQTAATLSLIMEQTADAHGKFAREGDTLSHQVQVWKARLESFGEKVGAAIIPPVTSLAARLGDTLGPKLEALGDWIVTTGVPALAQFGERLASEWGPRLQQAGDWIGTTVVPALAQFGDFLSSTVIPAISAVASAFATEWLPRLQAVASWIASTLIPAVASLAGFLISTLVPAVNAVAGFLADNAAAIAPIAAVILTLVAAWRAWVTVLEIWRVVQLAATAVQAAFNAVAAMNPLGLIVVAIAAVVAGIAAFLATHEEARQKLAEIWEGIKAAFGAAIDGIKAAIQWFAELPGRFAEWFTSARAAAANALNSLVSFVSSIPGRVVSALAALGGMLLSAATSHFTNIVTGATTAASSLVSFVSSIPGRILSALGNLGSLLLSAGRDLVQGMINGVTNMVGALVDKVKNMASSAVNAVKSFLGIASPSKVFTKLGEFTGLGFVTGLERMQGAAAAAARGLVAIPTPPAFPLPREGAARAALAGAQIVINVDALVPTPDTGRIIADALERHLRLNGGRTGLGVFA